MQGLANIFWLGRKELRSLFRDPVLLVLIVWGFSLNVYLQAASTTQELHNGLIGVVDEDRSELSRRIVSAFLPPLWKPPELIAERDILPDLDQSKCTFILDIPPNFERDALGGRNPGIQLNVDATAMVQAGLGSGYAPQIIDAEIANFVSRNEGTFCRDRKTYRRRRRPWRCVSPSIPMTRHPGSPASWASSTT